MPVTYACHFGICVSDLERSMRFYRDVLGFCESTKLHVEGEPTETQLGLDDLVLDAFFLERDGLRIELLGFASPGHEGGDGPGPMNRLGPTHMMMRVDELDVLLDAIVAEGGRVLSRISNAEWQSEVAVATDPDGTRIELVSMPGDPAAPMGVPIGRS